MHREAAEAAAPKYALFERERRWRVDRAERPSLDGRQHRLIEDRYIVDTRLRLRRMTDSATGECALKLTKKYHAPDPLARAIVTTYLTEDEYRLFEALPARPLRKRRFAVEHDDLFFSVDCFEGSLEGLELVEIEQGETELHAIRAPAWAASEVSHDPDYQGASLARFGIPRTE